MNKEMVNMTNWELYIYDEKYNLSGFADNHLRLGKNTYVSMTSSLVSYTFDEDVLIYETKNTYYVCPLKYMITYPYKNVIESYKEELAHRDEKSDSILDKIIAASAKISIIETGKKYDKFVNDNFLKKIKELQKQGQKEIEEMEQKENKRLIDIACNYEDCIYIELSNVEQGSLMAYHLGNYTGVVYPSLHVGMFQNSVLYRKFESKDNPVNMDFRYFPMGGNLVIETYSWSDNIKKAVIKNETRDAINFNGKDIPVGETMIFSHKCKYL